VGGHTDNTGSAAANMALSQRRADAVRDALVKDGVDSAMLTTKGYGETKPVASNDTPEGRLQNRRTEFTAASVGETTTTTTTKP
jgi:outer membrane protein OmpA-like peptidoglycan-associated protein